MRSSLTHSLHVYNKNENLGTATIKNNKDTFDKNYDLLANKLNVNGTKHADDGAAQIIESLCPFNY